MRVFRQHDPFDGQEEINMSTSSHSGIQWIFRVYNIYTLEQDYSWESGHKIPQDLVFRDLKKNKVRMIIEKSGRITIKKNYSWDGCTPKFSILDLFLVGTPDGIRAGREMKPKTYYASLVHDALYQFIPDMDDKTLITRDDADNFFYTMLEESDFALRKLYWLAVHLFGGFFMYTRKNVTRQTEGCAEPWNPGIEEIVPTLAAS